jgi:dsDNA-specific endonuclease/ATPase MutS2
MRVEPTTGGVRIPTREPVGQSGGDGGDTATLLGRLIDLVRGAKSMPLSTSILLSKDEVMELLNAALERLPGELYEARRILREREDLLNQAQHEAEDLLEAGRNQAARLVERTDIMRMARQASQRIVDEAKVEANRLRFEAEDYCDQRLAAFEALLDKTMKVVRGGRKKLADRVTPSGEIKRLATGETPIVDNGFFDQDQPD